MIHTMQEKRERRTDYTVRELADRWDVTVRTVRYWIDAGYFPNAYRVGLGRASHFRIPAEDVADFERRRKNR